MRARDLFGAAVRILGVWFLADAAYWVSWIVWRLNGGEGNPNVSLQRDFAEAIVRLIQGALLILLADPIVWLSYGLPLKINTGILATDPEKPTESG
jgi:hypothetical protein